MSGNQLMLAGAPGTVANYIEDVFSTYLYTGTGATQTITNGIDLSTKGGLVWTKERTSVAGAVGHQLTDTARGYEYQLSSDSTAAQTNEFNRLTSFNTNGFTLGNSSYVNANTGSWVSWTFREQPKFFDIVTYTGNGSTQNISHNLGSTPGCIIIKCTSNADQWIVYHRSTGTSKFLYLNTTGAEQTYSWISSVGSTSFTLNDGSSLYNANGRTYVAYLFAHDAGGFGLTGSDNVISCGSFTTDGSGNATVSLGYEPQWVMIKRTDSTSAWIILDNMRGWTVTTDASLSANSSAAENTPSNWGSPNATGFTIDSNAFGTSATCIYIAIRRGPMKTPTSGTSVYTPIARSGNSTATTVTGVGFPPDLVFEAPRTNSGANNWIWFDRLRGGDVGLSSDNSGAEFTNSAVIQSDSLSTTMDGFRIQTANPINASGNTYIYYPLRRAPGFFDVVCYTGTGANTTVSHNLGVTPELIFVKRRNSTGNWIVYANNDPTDYLLLNLDSATADLDTVWNDTSPTSTNFTVGTVASVNASGGTYVAYLFASVSGVSKVGSYTGTGTTLQVNCGFTGGSRFVLIKRTDSTGDWYVWDSARGIVAGNDPYLLLNSTAAEVTNTDYVDTYSAGFEISSTAPAAINANGGTFIFLAIA